MGRHLARASSEAWCDTSGGITFASRSATRWRLSAGASSTRTFAQGARDSARISSQQDRAGSDLKSIFICSVCEVQMNIFCRAAPTKCCICGYSVTGEPEVPAGGRDGRRRGGQVAQLEMFWQCPDDGIIHCEACAHHTGREGCLLRQSGSGRVKFTHSWGSAPPKRRPLRSSAARTGSACLVSQPSAA